jgi:hypothetical protein
MMKHNAFEDMVKRFDDAAEEIIRNYGGAQDGLSPEEYDSINEDAAERREKLPWHPAQGNAPQHSMADSPAPRTKNMRRF